MTANQKDSLTRLFSSQTSWHLLTAKPEAIPDTHAYREISHDEFRVLSPYLDTYRKLGNIVVRDAVEAVILERLTGIKTKQCQEIQDSYHHDKVFRNFGGNDRALVAYGVIGGMYVQISYSQADRSKFRQMVVTGIVEPKATANPPISKLLVLSELVSKNYRRISEARKLLSNTKNDEDQRGLEGLILQFASQNDSEIRASKVIPVILDNAISQIELELKLLNAEHKQSVLLLQIDSRIDQEDGVMAFGHNCEREAQEYCRASAIQHNILEHKRMLVDLKTLKDYLLKLSEESK